MRLWFGDVALYLNRDRKERGGHAATGSTVGRRIEEEIREEIDHPRVVPEPAERMVAGIDGAFIKAGHTRPGQRHQFEILTGRVEASQLGGEAFAVVRDLDQYAKRRVQAILRRCGRGKDTDLRILGWSRSALRSLPGSCGFALARLFHPAMEGGQLGTYLAQQCRRHLRRQLIHRLHVVSKAVFGHLSPELGTVGTGMPGMYSAPHARIVDFLADLRE